MESEDAEHQDEGDDTNQPAQDVAGWGDIIDGKFGPAGKQEQNALQHHVGQNPAEDHGGSHREGGEEAGKNAREFGPKLFEGHV